MKLNGNEYSKVTGQKFRKKNLAPLLGAKMAHCGPERAPFGKKLQNASYFFYFWNDFRTN